MAKGGRREGAGRKPLPRPERVVGIKVATDLLEALNRPKNSSDSYEVQKWRELIEAQDLRIRLDTRKYLYDKRDGKAVQPIEGMNDRPLEVTIVNHIERPVRK